MFGLKKKKAPKKKAQQSGDDLLVHTMQDDIAALTQGAVPTSSTANNQHTTDTQPKEKKLGFFGRSKKKDVEESQAVNNLGATADQPVKGTLPSQELEASPFLNVQEPVIATTQPQPNTVQPTSQPSAQGVNSKLPNQEVANPIQLATKDQIAANVSMGVQTDRTGAAANNQNTKLASADLPGAKTQTQDMMTPSSSQADNPFFASPEQPTMDNAAQQAAPKESFTPETSFFTKEGAADQLPAGTKSQKDADAAFEKLVSEMPQTGKTAKNKSQPSPLDDALRSAEIGSSKDINIPGLKIDGMPSPAKSSSRKIGKIIAGITTLLLLIGGAILAWYLWQTKGGFIADLLKKDEKQEEGATNLTEDQVNTELPEEAGDTQPEKPSNSIKQYSTELPNTIEITDGTTAAQDFSQKIDEINRNLPIQEDRLPVEFLVTDAAGNPITLESFVFLTETALDQSILDAASDAFKIYAVPDNGEVRFGLGLGIEADKEQEMRSALLAAEPSMPNLAQAFYPEIPFKSPLGSFSDNIYGDYVVRYLNMTESESISIDYTVTDKNVYIGTSQLSQRTILDRYDQDEITAQGVGQGSDVAEGSQQTGPTDTNTEIFNAPSTL